MLALFPSAMSLVGYFWPRGEVFGGEGFIGVWEGLRTEFGKGLPCSEEFFLVDMLLVDHLRTFRVGLIGEGVWGEVGGLEIQIWAGIHLFGGVFCVRIGAGRLLWG